MLLLAGCQTSESGHDEDLNRIRALNAIDEQRYDLARQYLAAARQPETGAGSAPPSDPASAEWLRLEAEVWSSGTLQSATRALESWRTYLDLRPDDQAARLEEARALFILGEWQAVADVSTQVTSQPQSSVAQVLRLRALAELDPQLAFGELPQPVPDDATLQATAARIYRALDDPAALQHAQRAIELDPLDRQSRYLLARLYQSDGDRAAAAGQLEMQQLLSRFEGAGSVDPPSAGERLELLATLGARLPELPRALRLERLRLRVEAGQMSAATTDLEQLAANPEGSESAELLEFAGLARRAGQAAMAREFLTTVLGRAKGAADVSPNPTTGLLATQSNWREAVYGLALLAYEDGDHAAATEWLNPWTTEAPQYSRGHHLLGRIQLATAANQADESGAEESFSEALRLAPWNAACRIDLANLWLSHGRLDEALELVNAAPEPAPELERFVRRHE